MTDGTHVIHRSELSCDLRNVAQNNRCTLSSADCHIQKLELMTYRYLCWVVLLADWHRSHNWVYRHVNDTARMIHCQQDLLLMMSVHQPRKS